jgi:mono/diheme cytochrome c family protein
MRPKSATLIRVRHLVIGLTLLSGLTSRLAAQGSESAPKGPNDLAVAKGKVIYQRYCAACHGKQGIGDGPLATELRTPPVDLTRLAEKNHGVFPLQAVARAIDGRDTKRSHGTPDMPVWGEVFPRTTGTEAASVDSAVEQVAHYIWSIQRARSD